MIAPRYSHPGRLGVGPEEGGVAPCLDEREGSRGEHHCRQADDHRPDRPHDDQPPVERGHQQSQRIARRRQKQRVDDEHRAHRVGQAGQAAEDEIAAPADRLKHPEGAILVVEEGPVETRPRRGSDEQALSPARGWRGPARRPRRAPARCRPPSPPGSTQPGPSARYRRMLSQPPSLGVGGPPGLGCRPAKERRDERRVPARKLPVDGRRHPGRLGGHRLAFHALRQRRCPTAC